jgi:hypothetical protein
MVVGNQKKERWRNIEKEKKRGGGVVKETKAFFLLVVCEFFFTISKGYSSNIFIDFLYTLR